MEHNVQYHGTIGHLLTIVSALGAVMSFLAEHYAIVTVPFSIYAAYRAIRYYRTAEDYYKSKKRKNDDGHNRNATKDNGSGSK